MRCINSAYTISVKALLYELFEQAYIRLIYSWEGVVAISMSVNRLFISLLIGFFLCLSSWAAELKCDVCGMPIHDHGRNHVVLSGDSSDLKPMHVCSPACAKKVRKHDAKYSKAEVTDFNHPDKTIPGDKAYFLIQSSKIKSDMGADVMAPFAAAFATKEEAEAAKAKYGDGVVVQGAENAFK